ncbi:DUF6192 family protein [Streptomyces sp. NPDC094438]|uniref:DUF6192 family protein n=1 Tax=Streptomyces sp. NPDC094438 TaxID=3366061 RepID=UPI00381C0F2B
MSSWSVDVANRRVGVVGTPVSPQEKSSAIHAFAPADEVVAEVSGDLRRQAASKFTSEDRVRVVDLRPGW